MDVKYEMRAHYHLNLEESVVERFNKICYCPFLQRLAADFMTNYIFLAVGRVGSSTDLIVQRVQYVTDKEKRSTLIDLINSQNANAKQGTGSGKVICSYLRSEFGSILWYLWVFFVSNSLLLSCFRNIDGTATFDPCVCGNQTRSRCLRRLVMPHGISSNHYTW